MSLASDVKAELQRIAGAVEGLVNHLPPEVSTDGATVVTDLKKVAEDGVDAAVNEAAGPQLGSDLVAVINPALEKEAARLEQEGADQVAQIQAETESKVAALRNAQSQLAAGQTSAASGDQGATV